MTSNDTYKGESLQKKCARYDLHWMVKEHLDEVAPESHRSGLHFVLASREGGDLSVLSSMNVPPSNVIALDRRQDALDACAKKYPGHTHFVHCADAGDEIARAIGCVSAARHRTRACGDESCSYCAWARTKSDPRVAHVFLDFCGHIGRETMTAMSKVWASMSVGSVLSVGLLKGREKKQSASAVTVGQNRKQRRGINRRARGSNLSALTPLCAMMTGRAKWDARALLKLQHDDIAKLGGIEKDPALCRLLLLMSALGIVDRRASKQLVAMIEYQSQTSAGKGVPMVIFSFRKLPHSGDIIEGAAMKQIDEASAKNWWVSLVEECSPSLVAASANVSPGSARAFKAHASRGTYSKAS